MIIVTNNRREIISGGGGERDDKQNIADDKQNGTKIESGERKRRVEKDQAH
jgi:hypothetical protein